VDVFFRDKWRGFKGGKKVLWGQGSDAALSLNNADAEYCTFKCIVFGKVKFNAISQ